MIFNLAYASIKSSHTLYYLLLFSYFSLLASSLTFTKIF